MAFKYEFFNPAIKGLSPQVAARVIKALDAAIIYGAIEYGEGRMCDKEMLKKHYARKVADLNAHETFGNEK